MKVVKKIVYLHDINHILSGFGTDATGEAEVSAWELASGFSKGTRIAYLYSPFGLLIGALICPVRTWRAWKKGRSTRNSTHLNWSKEKDLNSSVEEVVAELSKN